jgi:hypothetical protein
MYKGYVHLHDALIFNAIDIVNKGFSLTFYFV